MPQPGTPGPIELYQSAVDFMQPIIAGVRPDQMDLPTPCSEWNVRQIINHNLKVAECTLSLLSGTGFVNPMEVDHPLPSEGAPAAFEAATSAILEAIKSPGAAERFIETPVMSMSAPQLLMQVFGDLLIHRWDLATATGQDTSMDPALAEICYNLIEPQMEGSRQMGMFGPLVTVPPNASARDKLLGLAGRTP